MDAQFRWRRFGLGAAVTVGYVLAAVLGFRFAFVAEQVTTVWAPTGIGVAALLLWGRDLWPAIWVGAFVANAGTAPFWAAAAVATGNTAEAVIAASLLRQIPRFDVRLRRVRDVLAFIVIAAIGSTTISATIGVISLCAAGVQPWDRFPELWQDWWLGDTVGALVVGPVILTFSRVVSWSRREWLEAGGLIGGALLTTHLVFGQAFGAVVASYPYPVEYVVFPFVVAAAVRAGQPVTALVVLGSAAVTIYSTVMNAGAFSTQLHDSLILLEVFMGVLAGTGLLLAAAIAERETGERRRAAAHGVSQVLANATDLAEAAPSLLRSVCEHLEWQIGALWLVDEDDRIRCQAVWSHDAISGSSFAQLTREIVFARGIGLPGRVWASGDAAWIDNVVDDPNFPRATVAREAGVHGAFGVPIRLGGKVIGILEFFNRTVVPADPDLLRTMSTLGYQVGQFIGRKRDEEATAAAQQREAAARAEAEAANRAKDEFLATLSHELRTPLNAIQGWAQMLQHGIPDAARTAHAIDAIVRNAAAQGRLIEDLLDLSRIISGKLRLDVEPVDVPAVVRAAVATMEPAAHAKGVRILTRFDKGGGRVYGDRQRLQQAVWNLISNSVKFTSAGGEVRVHVVQGDIDVEIVVSDTGQGIAPDVLPYIFDRFRQGDSSSTRQHAGLGLGLAIVRHIVELHGGTIETASDGIGKGATFRLRLPLGVERASPIYEPARPARPTTVSAGTLSPAELPDLDGARILIVEDEPDARDMVAQLLRARHADVATASSVDEALQMLETFQADVLLSDIEMPGRDGYDLIRTLRARPASRGGGLPAAAVTAYSRPEDRSRSLLAGFDAHLSKPVDLAELIATIVRLSSGRTRDASVH